PSRQRSPATLAGWYALQFQILQVVAKIRAEVVAAQCKFDGRFQKSELVAGIVARPFKAVAVYRPVSKQMFQAIRQLDFAAASGTDGFERFKDLGREHVSTNDG